MKSSFLLGALAALSTATSVFAQPAPMSSTDYVTAAAQSDQFEIQEGRLAESKSKTPALRRFARQMVQDHTLSSKIVSQAARKSGMVPPVPPLPALRPDQQQQLSALQAASGPEFDHMYLQQQLTAHQEALQLHSSYAQSGSDPNLRAAAGQVVPVVQQHLSMLQSMPSP
jgi:putative membrane protein